ncbi:hypothetical protein SADUNF_Sadunf12G0061600 [Salix dunnii]|uniref:Uncharacterized protein n=1 Tax=Salix dunnii TaxID=1413687 RepID=A0A835JND0_9ROSI|nr:hypothetical protein SADUNF_Sadunf12G0061600 [Salix dunnii]
MNDRTMEPFYLKLYRFLKLQQALTVQPGQLIGSKARPKMYMYPPFYDLYRPKPPPSEMIIGIAERIASLPPEEKSQFGPALGCNLKHP